MRLHRQSPTQAPAARHSARAAHSPGPRMTVTEERGPLRVHIIGGPGSGKTTFARRLAAELGVPVHDLDVIALSDGVGPGFEPLRPAHLRVDDVHRLAGGEAWITEGSYLGWTDKLLCTAALIVWLDPPWRRAMLRIVRREIRVWIQDVVRRRGVGPRIRMLRHPHVLPLIRFLCWTHGYYHRGGGDTSGADVRADDFAALTRYATAHYLDVHRGKVIHCVRQPDVTDMAARLLSSSLIRGGPGRPG